MSSSTAAAMGDYDVARRRMLDAEEVATSRILKESLAPMLAERPDAN